MSEAVVATPQTEALPVVVAASDRMVERFTQEGVTLQDRASQLVIQNEAGVVSGKASISNCPSDTTPTTPAATVQMMTSRRFRSEKSMTWLSRSMVARAR